MARAKMINAPEVTYMDIIARLIEQLGAEDEVVRIQAGQVLLQMGAAVVRPLIEALQNPRHPARPFIAATLGQIGDRRAVEPLIQALRDPDKEVRLHAALALGQLKDRRAIKPLIYALFDEMPSLGLDPLTGDPLTVRAAAAQALGELKAKEAVPALKVLLRDDNKGVRRAVVQALGQIGTEDAILALCEAAWREKDDALWEAIVRTLAKHPFPQALEMLQKLASQHPEEERRKQAAQALRGAEPLEPPPSDFRAVPAKKQPSRFFRFLKGALTVLLLAGLFRWGWRSHRAGTFAVATLLALVSLGWWHHRRRTPPDQLPAPLSPLQPSAPSKHETE
ncbi:MAG: hypothetical protein C4295_06860 [Candidatus Fervidibacterota bacterium]